MDCGVYVIEFARYLVDKSMPSTAEDINNSFSSYFNAFKFSESQANAARYTYLEDIDHLSAAYAAYRKREASRRLDRKSMKRKGEVQDDGGTCGAPKDLQSALVGCDPSLPSDIDNCSTDSTSSGEHLATMMGHSPSRPQESMVDVGTEVGRSEQQGSPAALSTRLDKFDDLNPLDSRTLRNKKIVP